MSEFGLIAADDLLFGRPPKTTASRSEDASADEEPLVRDRWESRFWPILVPITLLAAIIRLVYILTDDRQFIGFDGFDYRLSALRLADGFGYTSAVGHGAVPSAHRPPAWGTLLGAVSWLGGRSVQAHQLTAAALGLAVVVLVAMIGRRYFDARVGLVAGLLAAVYPGFWLLEGNMLAEPLALVLLGVLTLLVADLRDRPTLVRSAVVGGIGGLLVLTRSEQVAFMAVVVVPLLLMARSLSMAKRIARIGVAAFVCVAVLTPWAVFNSSRFHEFVPVSTSDGTTLLAANCPPGSFTGERLGFWDTSCLERISRQHPRFDESQVNGVARRVALTHLRDHADRLPIVVPARIGRMFAIFRPGQTVEFVAQWMSVDTGLIWAWVASFWVILVLAVIGVVIAQRRRIAWWPLAAPFLVAVVAAAVTHGEPRDHTLADLGLLVLAAFVVERLFAHRAQAIPTPPVPPSAGSPGGTRRRRPGRLPSVYLPG